MSYFNQSKWWPPILMILCVINIGTISFFWWDKWHPQQPKAPIHANGPVQFLIHELNLNKQQQASYDSLIQQHKTQMEALKPSLRDAKDSFYALLKNTSTNDSLFTKSLERIGQLQQNLDKLTFEHFSQVRKLCTPQQREIFDDIIVQAIKMMAPPPHKGNQHPPLSNHERAVEPPPPVQ